MIAQACTPMGFVSVAVTPTAAVGFTNAFVTGTTSFVIPPGANLVLLAAETGAVRWRDDGVAPTPTKGMLMQVTVAPFEYSGTPSALEFISVSGTVSVDASFYKVAG